MPVATVPDEEKQPDKPNLVIQEIPITSQVVDTRTQRYDTTMTFLPGYKWPVDYYSQVLAKDSAPASSQADLPIPYGTTRLIRNMEIVVEEPIRPEQQDGGGRGWRATGTGVLYGVITPQDGDVFLADMGDGKNAVFQITNPKRLSVFQEAPYRVDFAATKYVTAEVLLELNKRVVQTLFFVKDNFKNGVKALLTQSEGDAHIRLQSAFRRMTGRFFHDFFSDRFQTFIAPMQEMPTYDPYVTRFMRAILGTGLHPQAMSITELGMGGDVFYNETTIFDVILAKDVDLLYSCTKKMGISSIRNYRTSPLMASVYSSGVSGVVSPREVNFSVNHEGKFPHAFTDIRKAGAGSRKLADILPRLDLLLDETEPYPADGQYIKRVVVDDYYVLSEAFYKQKEGQSQLENLLLGLLKAEPVDINALANLCDYAEKFDNLERFYYTPLLLAMIKLAPGVL